MTAFHEGQDVEVWGANMYPWRKAKIVTRTVLARYLNQYEVQFPDGTRAVFDDEHIRAVETIDDIRLGHSGEAGADP